MHTTRMSNVIAVLVLTQSLSWGQAPAGGDHRLDENLKLLEPLVNKKWVGEIKALDSDEYLEIVRRFDVVWRGSAIRITGYCRALESEREGYIYWDSAEERIAMFAINNRGIVQQGHIGEQQGSIVIAGHITFPDRKLEFKNTFELTQDGKLVDKWYRLENGEWLPGHSVELVAGE